MKICNRCVMNDLSDKTITFDNNGICNYCSEALQKMNSIYFPNNEGKIKYDIIINEIKEKGKNNKYDCSIGISGGIDSSYLAYLVYKEGLKVLAFHIDDGFDTDVTKRNIDKLVNKTKIDLIVIKPDEFQFNELTKAYMRAGVPNIAIPQDNILFANLYKYSKKNSIKYFISGGNYATESILQHGNTHNSLDLVNIKDINKKYGKYPIDKLDFISRLDKKLLNIKFKLKEVRLLNYIDYNKDRAMNELNDFCGFEYYGSKHLENILTAFLQLYWLPKKFGVDKRTSHFSSLIVSGQMTRDKAIEELKKPLYEEKIMRSYIEIVKEKLNISDIEFNEIMDAPTHQHDEFKTDKLYDCLVRMKRLISIK